MDLGQYLDYATETQKQVQNFLALEKSRCSEKISVKSSDIDYSLFTWNY